MTEQATIQLLTAIMEGRKETIPSLRWKWLGVKQKARRLFQEQPEKYKAAEQEFEQEVLFAKESL